MRGLARALLLLVLASALAGCGLGGGAGASSSPAPAASGSAGTGDALTRGLAAHTAGRLDEAIKLYYEALSVDPTNKFAFFNLGQIEHTRNHLVAAEAWYRLALESDKSMPQPLYNLALVRQAVGDSTESASLLRRLIALQPNNASAHWNLGLALRTLGQTADANAEFATAQRLDARLVPPPSSSVRPSPTR
jgi:Flp pilus assembly protein TadD